MTITNPFIETKSTAPAVLGGLVAAVATAIFGLVVLFHFHPPIVWDQQGPLYLNLVVLGQAVSTFLRGETCEPGLWKLIGLTCRLDYAGAVF